jgi:23S rRNA pseudouridine1911/1915/1917 synthase
MIIFEDKNYLIIDKPAGLMTHSDGRSQEKTLCNFLLENFPELKNVGEPLKLSNGNIITKPGIVHRLDKETSGIMIVVRNQKTFNYFKEQFKNHKIQKTYHAFVYNNIKKDKGIIDSPIGRSRNDFRQWQAGSKARGEMREAVTQFSVLGRATDKTFTFLEIKPKTGRTHQIRVHFKSIFHPLIADSLYAPNRGNNLGFQRLALHSFSLEFVDPDGCSRQFKAFYPKDFLEATKSPLLVLI